MSVEDGSIPVTVCYSGHHERLVSGLWSSLLSNRRVDFEVQSIRGHLLILDVFLSQESLNRMTETDLYGKALGFLLEFLYMGRVTVPMDQLGRLSEVAKELKFDMLVEAVSAACDSLSNTSILTSSPEIQQLPVCRTERHDIPENNSAAAIDAAEIVPGTETALEPPVEVLPTSNRNSDLLSCLLDHLSSSSSESDRNSVAKTNKIKRSVAMKRLSVSRLKDDVDCQGRTSAAQSLSARTGLGVSAAKKHSCPDCSFTCVRLSDLKVHAVALHSGGVKPFKCSQCDFASSRKSQVNSHIRGAHLNIKPCLCDLCGYRTISKSRLDRHKMRHSEIKAYICDVCGEAYRYHASLWRHAKRHVRDAKPFMCHLCGHSSREKHSFKIHLENAHKSTFKCRLCDFWCSSCVGLGKHRQTAHPNTKPFPCTECDYSCRSRSTLMEHMRRHTGERPYKCNICSKTFAQRGYYDIHVRKHLENQETRLLSCQECSAVFDRRIELRRHLRSAHKNLSATVQKPAT